MGRLLGLDYGTRRVGVAISDTSQVIATPLAVFPADEAVEAVAAVAADEEVEAIVVGLPVALSGEEGAAARAARGFAEEVAARTGLEVILADERFTTKVAEDALIAGGMRRDKRRNVRDKMAATVMLQGHLDSLR